MASRSVLGKSFLIGALGGVAVAIGLYGKYIATDQLFGELELMLWPSSILLMATDNAPILDTSIIVVVSLAGNALLYGLGAMVIAVGFRFVRSRSS